MIELQNVTAGYGKHTVLRDISLTFEKGKLTSVIGVNGSGKSTLLKAILGMIPLDRGEILVDGKNLGGMPRKEIAQKIAYLSQGKSTPDMTVEQLVLHGRFPYLSYPRRYTEKDREIALSAMAQTGITDLAQQPLRTLSGGMLQTVYIAMALAQDTEYILLDEPTTYLDIAHQVELMGTLRKLSEAGKGVIAVMHDLPMAFTYSDRLVLLREGTVFGEDTPQEICRQNAVEQLFGVRLERSADGQSYAYGLFRK